MRSRFRRIFDVVAVGFLLVTLAWQLVPGLRELPAKLLTPAAPAEGSTAEETGEPEEEWRSVKHLREMWAKIQERLGRLEPGSLARVGRILGLVVGVLQVAVIGWIAVGLIMLILAKRVWQPQAMLEQGVGIEIVVPKGVDADARKMIGLLRALRMSFPVGGLRNVTRFALEVIYKAGKVHFVVWCPAKRAAIVRDRLKGVFPKARYIERDVLGVALAQLQQGQCVVWKEVALQNAPYLPLRSGSREFEGEPLDMLVESLEPADEGVDLVALSLVCRPVKGDWKKDGRATVYAMTAPQMDGQGRSRRAVLDEDQRRVRDALKGKLAGDGFEVVGRIVVAGYNRSACGSKAWSVVQALQVYSSDAGGSPQGFAEQSDAMVEIGPENPFAVAFASGQEN